DPRPVTGISPFSTFQQKPIWNSDWAGDSTFVSSGENGNYNVIGGNLKGDDKGVYVVDKNNKNKNRIGESLTTHSFVDDKNKFVVGAEINLSSIEGQNFFDSEIKNVDLFKYMNNAQGGETFDFKTRKMPIGLNDKEQEQYK